MDHPFTALRAEYAALAARARIRPECEHILQITAERLLHDEPVYARIYEATGVPIAFLMALSEREMSGNLHCYLGNGQRLTRRTTIVPKGRGPFPDSPDGFFAGAVDALRLDGLDKFITEFGEWTKPLACYASEDWNGWGYRQFKIPSPYVFGGTTVQEPGKYIRDHQYDPGLMDPQLGTFAIMTKLIELDPGLDFGPPLPEAQATCPVPTAAPVGVGGGVDVAALQIKLNGLHVAVLPLKVDGIYGRGTKEAVRNFQARAGLQVDGFAGPMTLKALGLS